MNHYLAVEGPLPYSSRSLEGERVSLLLAHLYKSFPILLLGDLRQRMLEDTLLVTAPCLDALRRSLLVVALDVEVGDLSQSRRVIIVNPPSFCSGGELPKEVTRVRPEGLSRHLKLACRLLLLDLLQPSRVGPLFVFMLKDLGVDDEPLDQLVHGEGRGVFLLELGPSAVDDRIDAPPRRHLQVHVLAQKLETLASWRHLDRSCSDLKSLEQWLQRA
mmetsp:Transcript_16948/g.26093  ORF Transcript_16948/g.26093 Transcript_16948/m.26093 type:complete len:217 (-) Transcript_16948:392-1042(-)|eukprot:CAMPEP_0170498992 /NCGR_PEP_ID=MMETSP0208-20121228/29714_1 /TAXON_ID=197538 /ORGANISM="Strombidium inclinatum, Strain S3" /LENGTH=216 /DNA_ID=CAMNT_0010776367 /DNA_START=560 /DNA_END=1210 /DNA_ORIENTATION=+